MDIFLIVFLIVVFLILVALCLHSIKIVEEPSEEEPIDPAHVSLYDRRYQSIMSFPKASKGLDRIKKEEEE